MAGNASWGDVLSTTLERRRGLIADNVLNHDPFLAWLNANGRVDTADGGASLLEPVSYPGNDQFAYYSGFEALSVSKTEVISSAEFNWKQAAVPVAISGLDMRKNNGASQIFDLLGQQITVAERTMSNNLADGAFSDGTGSGGKQIGGLQLLVADDPTTGTVGGIDRSTNTWWRSFSFDATTTGGAAASATNIQGYMNTVALNVVFNRDFPDLVVADANYFNFYWQSLQAIQRITSESSAAAGFETLAYYGPGGRAAVMYDSSAPTNHMYFINSMFLRLRPHSQANMSPTPQKSAVNQDATVVHILFQGNLTSNGLRYHGLLKD